VLAGTGTNVHGEASHDMVRFLNILGTLARPTRRP
jgi:hypothetical protein